MTAGARRPSWRHDSGVPRRRAQVIHPCIVTRNMAVSTINYIWRRAPRTYKWLRHGVAVQMSSMDQGKTQGAQASLV
jgi:hypothetical protein